MDGLHVLREHNRIADIFLKLTEYTVPYRTESSLESLLPDNIQKDVHGNYFINVKNNHKDSRVIFTSHLDTADSIRTKVKHVYDKEKDIIKTDGSSILGADCKAGVTIMLEMIRNNIPGLYYFFLGEECGGIGSSKAKEDIIKFNSNNYDKVISFDRRGMNSIITHQSGTRTCSDKFANALSKEFSNHFLDMVPDSTGLYTDSCEFIEQIPECTNISVGYYNEHTYNEYQKIDFLTYMCEVCCEIDWEGLPTDRNVNDNDIEYNYSDYADDDSSDDSIPDYEEIEKWYNNMSNTNPFDILNSINDDNDNNDNYPIAVPDIVGRHFMDKGNGELTVIDNPPKIEKPFKVKKLVPYYYNNHLSEIEMKDILMFLDPNDDDEKLIIDDIKNYLSL